jgi:hypothetical protein
MSSGKVKCTCGWSWNKSDSSKKDMYICHECGRDNSNNMQNGGWLDNYADGGTMQEHQENYNDYKVSAPKGMVGDGFSNVGRNYSPAWGGQFQMGGSIPGAVGFSYARTNDPAPSNGPYAKKTKASAQEGINIVPIKGRSHYSPLSNSIYLDETNGPSVKGHELYHYQQHQEGRDFIPEKWNWGPYLPPSQPQTPYTEEAASLGYNRRRLEAEGILQDMYKYMPDLQFMPKEVVEEGFNLSSGIHMQGIEDNMYDNPYTLEGEARLTETPEGRQQLEERGIGVRQFQNGGWLNKYDVAQTGMRILNEGDDFMKNNSRGKFNKAGKDLDQIIANNKERQKNRVVDIRQSPKKAVNDKIAASKKLHTTDLDKLNVRNKTQAEIDAEEAAYNKSVAEQRKATREKSDANVLNDWSEFFDSDNHTRQNWEDSTAGLESKFRVSDEPNFFDDYLNPFSMIGGMAADLGASPNQAKQTDSYLPYVTAIGTPLLTGALEGIGAKSNKEFVNNLINPANIVPGYKSAEKYLAPKIKKTLAKGALPILEGAKNLETLGREAVRGINDAVIYPIKYRKQIADVKKLHGELASQLGQDEGVKRLSGVLGIDPTNLDYPSLTTFPRIGSHYSPRLNNINMDFRQLNKFKNSPELMLSANTVHGHEVGHWMQREADRFSPKYKEALSNYNNSNNKSIFFEPLPTSNPTVIDRFAQQLYGYDRGTNMIDISDALSNQVDVNTLYDNAKYFTHQGTEALPHLREMRQNMLNKGYIKNIYDPISEETINKFISENPIDRISSFTKPGSKQTKGLETIFRNLPSVVGAGAVGTGAAYQMQNQQGAPQYEEGGVIKDDLGQWAHPGEITEINSNDITMEGVPYDVLGISDTGDTKLMKPGKKYKFKGKKVTEFPMAKNGLRQEQKGLVNLDNLTNFTNYNTKQPGGWLDQY